MIVADAWSPATTRLTLGGNLAGAGLLAVAAFAPPRRLRVPRRTIWLAAFALALVLAALAATLSGRGHWSFQPSSFDHTRTHLAPTAGRVAVQIAIAAVLFAAAVGLARRAGDRYEPLLRWAAVAVVLGGFAKLNYALVPPHESQAVHLADALRLLGWGALLFGVVEEVRLHWRAHEAAAIAGERRRIAREIHDDVAQELAFIRRRAGRLAQLPGGLEIVSAAERALEDSRRAIQALAPPADEPLDAALTRQAHMLAAQSGVEVQVVCRCRTDVSRAEVLRIVAEAVRNAAQHGGARHVHVDLAGPPLNVRVMDDGSGFALGAHSGRGVAGYGLIAMRERAEQVGGELSLESVPGAGTLVRVVLR